MLSHESASPHTLIFETLRRLGITPNYRGFFYVFYAVWLCSQRPDRLLLVTKWLYPEVAAHYHTNWKSVERNIRTVVTVAWNTNPNLLSELAGHPLVEKPWTAQFLAILTEGLFPHSGIALEDTVWIP